jgi:hypothetical protein
LDAVTKQLLVMMTMHALKTLVMQRKVVSTHHILLTIVMITTMLAPLTHVFVNQDVNTLLLFDQTAVHAPLTPVIQILDVCWRTPVECDDNDKCTVDSCDESQECELQQWVCLSD